MSSHHSANFTKSATNEPCELSKTRNPLGNVCELLSPLRVVLCIAVIRSLAIFAMSPKSFALCTIMLPLCSSYGKRTVCDIRFPNSLARVVVGAPDPTTPHRWAVVFQIFKFTVFQLDLSKAALRSGLLLAFCCLIGRHVVYRRHKLSYVRPVRLLA